MTTPESAAAQAGTVGAVVRRFVVQEQYADENNRRDWFDDCDQPIESELTLQSAIAWMDADIAACRGHGDAYNHRVIERTETVLHTPNTRLDRQEEART